MSTPPPSHAPTNAAPEPWARKHKRAIIASGIVALVVALVVIVNHQAQRCLVNGFGNRMCGDTAVAYCDLLERQGNLQPRPVTNDELRLFMTCTKIGWTPAS